jgi:hypothetical protein
MQADRADMCTFQHKSNLPYLRAMAIDLEGGSSTSALSPKKGIKATYVRVCVCVCVRMRVCIWRLILRGAAAPQPCLKKRESRPPMCVYVCVCVRMCVCIW